MKINSNNNFNHHQEVMDLSEMELFQEATAADPLDMADEA